MARRECRFDPMKEINRRSFLVKTAWAAGAGALAAGLRAPAWAAPVGANDAVRLGIIGCGAKAQAHIKQLMLRTDVRVVALCDVDPTQIAKAQAVLKPGTAAPFTTPDARALLARAEVVQRQAAARYLKTLVAEGVLREQESGREKLFFNVRLMRLLSSESNEPLL